MTVNVHTKYYNNMKINIVGNHFQNDKIWQLIKKKKKKKNLSKTYVIFYSLNQGET